MDWYEDVVGRELFRPFKKSSDGPFKRFMGWSDVEFWSYKGAESIYTVAQEGVSVETPIELFAYLLMSEKIQVPAKYDLARTTLETGMWEGAPLRERPGSAGQYSLSVKENSEEDDAFLFLSTLGFFKGGAVVDGSKKYVMTRGPVSSSIYTRFSRLRRHAFDQDLLAMISKKGRD